MVQNGLLTKLKSSWPIMATAAFVLVAVLSAWISQAYANGRTVTRVDNVEQQQEKHEATVIARWDRIEGKLDKVLDGNIRLRALFEMHIGIEPTLGEHDEIYLQTCPLHPGDGGCPDGCPSSYWMQQ